jgi:hypothetical protein
LCDLLSPIQAGEPEGVIHRRIVCDDQPELLSTGSEVFSEVISERIPALSR